MRKRKVNYPAPKTANKPTRTVGLTTSPTYTRSTVATINLAALEVRDDYSAGDRVRIGGEGLYSGELAVIESIVVGVIPAAMVRTEAGKSRRVRFVDLERVVAERAPAPAAPAPAASATAASAPTAAPEAISAEG